MAKKILVIDGHPNADSLNAAFTEAYYQQAVTEGVRVKKLIIRDLEFNPNLSFGYQKRTELEPDLLKAQEMILEADHLVWIHPVWWGGLPAILKGFIERVFLPGFAFKYRENSVWWDKLLSGKTGRIISTLDQPYFYYWLINGRPGIHQLKKMTLEFCGISPVKVTVFGPIRHSTETRRKKMLEQVAQSAVKDCR